MTKDYDSQEKTKEVMDFWNKYPLTCGLAHPSLLGDVDDKDLNKDFFKEVERKIRKWNYTAQDDNKPLHSKFVDYNLIKNKSVLDIGVGTGWSLVEFARQGCKITGIDITPRAVEISKRHLEVFNLDGKVIVADAQELPFEDEEFDFVHSWGCIHHIPNTSKVVKEIYRVLKKEARVFVGCMYYKYSAQALRMIIGRGILFGGLFKNGFNLQKLSSRYTDGASFGGNPLAKLYSKREVYKMFYDAGFRDIDVRVWVSPNTMNDFPLRQLPLGRLFPLTLKKFLASIFGWMILVWAKK